MSPSMARRLTTRKQQFLWVVNVAGAERRPHFFAVYERLRQLQGFVVEFTRSWPSLNAATIL
jgi:hypothetical protein